MRSGLITVLRTVRSHRGSHGSLFFSIERFLRLKEPKKWTVRGFSGRTVRSGPGFKTLDQTTWPACIGLFSDLEPKDLLGEKKKKLRRRRWKSRGCAKLKQQINNLAQIASHNLHLHLLLLFLLLSSFSPSSLSSFRGDCCGFSLCLGWFWILFFLFMFPMALVHVTWLGRI